MPPPLVFSVHLSSAKLKTTIELHYCRCLTVDIFNLRKMTMINNALYVLLKPEQMFDVCRTPIKHDSIICTQRTTLIALRKFLFIHLFPVVQ